MKYLKTFEKISNAKNLIIYVINVEKIATKDDFNEGEDPSTTQSFDLTREFGGIYNSFEEICEKTGLPSDKENWTAFEDGRMDCQTLEDDDSNLVEEGDKKMGEFKKGNITLWSCDYIFVIKFIEGLYTPSTKEIAQRLDI